MRGKEMLSKDQRENSEKGPQKNQEYKENHAIPSIWACDSIMEPQETWFSCDSCIFGIFAIFSPKQWNRSEVFPPMFYCQALFSKAIFSMNGHYFAFWFTKVNQGHLRQLIIFLFWQKMSDSGAPNMQNWLF